MQKVTYHKTLDMQKQGTQWSINAKLNDADSRCIIISITDGGKSFYLTENCSAKIYGLKPDGTKIYNDCTIEDGKCIYNITSQTVSYEGTVECELVISNNSQAITSPKFNIDVDNVLADEDAIESSNELTALTKATQDANKATYKANTSAARANAIAETVENKLANGELKGKDGDDYILTNSDKDDIAKKVADQQNIWRMIAQRELTQEVDAIEITTDMDGKAFNLEKAKIRLVLPKSETRDFQLAIDTEENAYGVWFDKKITDSNHTFQHFIFLDKCGTLRGALFSEGNYFQEDSYSEFGAVLDESQSAVSSTTTLINQFLFYDVQETFKFPIGTIIEIWGY